MLGNHNSAQRHREFCNHTSRIAPAIKIHADAKRIRLPIVILRCRSSIESRASDAGGFSRTRNLPSHLQIQKSAAAPSRQTTTGKVAFIGREVPFFECDRCASYQRWVVMQFG
jgi:hypothetical protein